MAGKGEPRKARLLFLRYDTTAEISGADGERLRELEEAAEVRGLQSQEIEEMRRIYEEHETGVFLEGPEYTKLGVTDANRFLENFRGIMEQGDFAYEHQFAFEAINCRVLVLDFMLRAYVVHRSGTAIAAYSDEDRMTLGRLVAEAERHGLPAELVADLRAFNRKRNTAVHHFLLGRTSYQEIGDAYADSVGLFERIAEAMSMPPMER